MSFGTDESDDSDNGILDVDKSVWQRDVFQAHSLNVTEPVHVPVWCDGPVGPGIVREGERGCLCSVGNVVECGLTYMDHVAENTARGGPPWLGE